VRIVGKIWVMGARRASTFNCLALGSLALGISMPCSAWGNADSGVSVFGGVASRYSSEAVPNSAFGGTSIVCTRLARDGRLGEFGLSLAYARYQADFSGVAANSVQVPLYRYRVSFLPTLLEGALKLPNHDPQSHLTPVFFAGVGAARVSSELRSEYDATTRPEQNIITETAHGWVPAASTGLEVRAWATAWMSAFARIEYLWTGSLSGSPFQALPIQEVPGLRSGVIAAGIRVTL